MKKNINSCKLVPGIPAQTEGGFHDTESEKVYENIVEAKYAYQLLKMRLLDINHWQDYCAMSFAEFRLYNTKGSFKESVLSRHDLVRINVYASPELGTIYYWVKISDIFFEEYEEFERTVIIFIPTSHPRNQQSEIAHFYSSTSSSAFVINRRGNILSAAVYGRNETPNLDTNFLGKIKNRIISFCAVVGLSKVQWRNFTDGILNTNGISMSGD
ncbi:hypothetical protein [Chryseobacterium sp. 2R14A]|uniref:hypothetical protein n=1 Tax=Chryseobacterium sp. 2R14A TaxID=3380353 RepID=UPI003CF287B8